jgi:hypothetical protein
MNELLLSNRRYGRARGVADAGDVGAFASAATIRANERMSRKSITSAGEWLYRSGQLSATSSAP